jgi:hypothetical protein
MFHSVPGVPRAKMERRNAFPACIHKLALRLSTVGEGLGLRRPFAYIELALS